VKSAGSFEVLADAFATAAQPACERAHGHLEDGGGFFVAELVDVDEFDRDAQLLRKRAQRGVEVLVERGLHQEGLRLGSVVVGGRDAPDHFVGIVQETGPASPGAIDLGVAEDRQQPRPGVTSVEGPDRSIRA